MIKNVIRNILEWVERKLYSSKLHPNIVYINKDKSIMVEHNTDEDAVNIFINNIVYKLPIQVFKSEEEYLESLEHSFIDDLDHLPLQELQSILLQYEEVEDYEKCIKIKDVINSKLKENDNQSSNNI